MVRAIALLLILTTAALCQSGTLLVLLKGGNALAFYTPEGKLIEKVPVGKHPHEMVLSPDNKYAYISDNGTMRIEHAGRGGNSVSIVDIAQRKRVGAISLGKFHRPHGIDFDPASNQLAVSVELPDQLLICDTKSRSVVKQIDTQGKAAHMVTYSPDGKMAYVSNTSSDTVAAVNLASDSVKLIQVKARPEGSVFSKDGKELYVVCREAATISVIDAAKNAVVDEIKTSAGPVRIGSTPDGTLVYAAMHDKKVEIADPKARKVLGSVDLDGTPISLQVSPDGQFAFASGEEQDTVFIVSVPERKLVRQFKTGPGSGPDPVQLVK